jgi:peptide/nickel transport system permease protein
MNGFLLTAIRKIAFFVAVLLGVSFAIIALSRQVPGDAIDQITDSPEQRAVLEAEMGLDQSLLRQYVHWWSKVLASDFGESWVIRQGERVSTLIGPAAWKTAQLVLPALLLTFAAASLLIGLFRYDGLFWSKRALRSVSHTMSVIPLFLLGYLVILGFNMPVYALVENGTIERPAWFALPAEETWLKYLLAVIVLAVGNGTLSDVLLHLEAEVTHLTRQEFMVSTRARGASWLRHFVPNILMPTMTIFVNKAGFFIGGVVVVEYVFNINGIGMMIWSAANQRDVPVVVAITFLIAALVASLHLMNDLLQVLVDPRVREG